MAYPKFLQTTAHLLSVERLPLGMEWYSLDGISLFPVYGAGGGISAMVCAILIAEISDAMEGMDFGPAGLHSSDYGLWFRIDFYAMDNEGIVRLKIVDAIKALEYAMQRKYEALNG